MFLSENFYINGIRNNQLNLYLVKFDKEVLSEVGSVYSKGVNVDTTNEYNPLVSLNSDDTNEITLNLALLDDSFTPMPWTETMVNEIINIFTENPINEFISDDFPDNIFYMTTTKIVKKFTYAKLGVLEITFKLASMYSYVRKTYDCTCVNTSNLKIENIGVNRYKPTIQVTNNGDESTVNKIGDIVTDINERIRSQLFDLQDLKYRDFNASLIPTVDKKTVIGVRTPQLRKLAKELSKDPDIEFFLRTLPHKYYEEYNLHGLIIESMKDYDKCIAEMNKFLPYIDNWATCDIISPKIFKKHLPELLDEIKVWMGSDHTYTIRFGIEMLMSFYLDDQFKPEYPETVAGIKSQEYYVNMMIAWYFATALAKQYEAVLPFIEEKRLEKWTHNKAIQKSVESYRITPEQKAYLKTLKIK